jgi:3-oxoacyl-[acyl-carrier-protein] synthase II
VKDFDPTVYMDRKEAKRSDPFVRYAVAAAEQALAQAGYDVRRPPPGRTGVLIGTGIGGISTFEEQCQLFLDKGPSRVSPLCLPMFIPDMAAGVVSIRIGAQGPNYATVSACASSAHAIGDAYRLIKRGEADVMVAGGAEAPITRMGVAAFSNMRALSTRNAEPEKASRPFDRDRNGFVMGEGAAVAILESRKHALDRGARILAEVVGCGMSADAHHMTQPSPGGEGAARAMLQCLAESQAHPSEVDYINAHGTSTQQGDIAEVRAVKEVFGDHARKLVMGSTKSMSGHLLGAAGALEFGICVKVLETSEIPPTINQENPDPECDLDCAPNAKVTREVEVALSNSFGFGGHNVSLALRRHAA